jgi:hypothetical protein
MIFGASTVVRDPVQYTTERYMQQMCIQVKHDRVIHATNQRYIHVVRDPEVVLWCAVNLAVTSWHI